MHQHLVRGRYLAPVFLSRFFSGVPDLVRRLLDRCTQRTVQFIRWVRNNLDRQAPWQSILEPLRRRYAINQE